MDNVQNISRCLGQSGTWSVIGTDGRLTTIPKAGFFQKLVAWFQGKEVHSPTNLTNLRNHIVTCLSETQVNKENAEFVIAVREKLEELKTKTKSQPNALDAAIEALNDWENNLRVINALNQFANNITIDEIASYLALPNTEKNDAVLGKIANGEWLTREEIKILRATAIAIHDRRLKA